MATVKLLTAAVLPYRNGRQVPHAEGDTVAISTLSESIARLLESGDPLLATVLERC
jgi:hypothetical protein